MKRTLFEIYYRLPAPLRSAAASLRGFYLKSWRYGYETSRLVREFSEREQWTREQWDTWQQERLAYVLRRAATQVPYYRELWAERRRLGDLQSWEQLENWPVLEKETLRESPTVFVADDCDRRQMYHEHTSGTTGKSLDLWWSRNTVRSWYALVEARCRVWYDITRYDRWAILGGQLVVPAATRKPPFWVWNAALSQLYMSSYHLAPDLIGHYLEALKRYRVTYLFGYTSSLHALAQEVLAQGRRDLAMKVVITNAEPVFDYQRADIERAFQCPVRETYGMAELVAGASECEAGHMHLWPSVGVVEVFQGDEPGRSDVPGDLVCTGLLNTDMPLIRYRVGDRGDLASPDQTCPCGRSLPLLNSVEGRCDDVLYTADGRRIGRLDPVFKAHLPVREAQIIQESLQQVRVRYVPATRFEDADAHSIVQRIRERMGDVNVVLEAVDQVPRTSSGKFRAVVCELPPEQRRLLAGIQR